MEKDIINEKTSGWLKIDSNLKEKIFDFCKGYIKFLNVAKTEREASKEIISNLKDCGFKNINDVQSLKEKDKVYMINRDKSIYAAVIGSKNITEGVNLVGAHIDSPRLDLKPNPLYEDIKLALFKTHYYGGIKKYQWTTIPLSIHGVIVKPSGEKIEVEIGEKEDDPIFTITDILPHLAQEQYEKKVGKAVTGEDLNVLVGSIPNDDDKVKENIMNLLNEKYGIKEIDFYSSELEVVPAFKAKDLGFDRSMVAAYGQDDRVCAYATLKALTDANAKDKTIVSIFADKEEIGSVGNTGMCSQMFDLFINELLNKKGENTPGALNKTYCNSMMLSADVGAGIDPNYKSTAEENNASKIGFGVELNKYTGSGGKSGASDANAEFVAKVRRIFEEKSVKYQVSELGKVDLGGGGTIAYILADKGMDVIDCGVPVISMHSPYEVTSKFDIYSAYLAYKAFFEED
ncbi:MAG TPA: aminopeptidase [Candidatus Aphodocola excrementigallinarum]|uniref:M18 family aminopeptidase n=1 Tax=Candidatus Aphodocola excrementigallinarum TaxID=2840670 RepID=A0A9D1IPC1_9FIRM|nr:aminopeptidase [Candidatus Aphodocola excrementigallinarum]